MTTPGPYEIHSDARGPHWIAWVSRPGSQQPDRSIVLVAETQEDANARAQALGHVNLQFTIVTIHKGSTSSIACKLSIANC